MIDLVNLKNHHCRYMPVDGLFCGARSEVGKSWCADHSKLVYTASRPRGVQVNKPLPKLLQGVRK
jgi:hypothetical protein